MAIASVVVATEAGAVEAVLAELALLPDTEVHGSKENQIVTVIEAASVAALTEGMQRLAAVARVTGVYPVYAGTDEAGE
ncbi:MAG: chaperone NapD [Desulfurivibrionaceae bacterium]